MNDSEHSGDVEALELMSRAMVGLTMRSVEVLGGEVSLPQFRLLLVLSGLGRVASSRLAAEMGLGASSVTRLADKLEVAGLLTRGTDPRSRSVVTLEVTPAAERLVARVVARRQELLAEVLGRLTSRERAEVSRVARRFADLAGDAVSTAAASPLPL
ncbi:MAG TPA: MarR family transcriptional regulator [Trebonia sp.]|nr:MarR family transcriptional regulator [Trebonia sp.]